jgi:hypothetical protein
MAVQRFASREMLSMNESGQDGIQNLVKAPACVLRQESQCQISICLEQSMLPAVAPTGFRIREMLRAIEIDDNPVSSTGPS